MNKPTEKLPAATNSPIVPLLTIPPYGAETFTDFGRSKHFTVLFYKHDGGARARVLAWIGDVIDDLTRAGLHVSDACEIRFTADQPRTDALTPKTKYRCHLKVPVQLLAGDWSQELMDQMRSHFAATG